MKIIKKIIDVLTTIIICVGGLFLILYIFGIVPYVVLSGSMEPTIETGSVCFINKHTNGIVTKGDNNREADSNVVNKRNFVGKNLFWIPKAGYVVKAFQTTKGRIIGVALIVLLLVSGFLFGDDKNKEKVSK